MKHLTDNADAMDLAVETTAEKRTGKMPAGAPLLSIENVTVRFGGILALDRVSFNVSAGQICGMIGPNGAGKTTLFNCLSRLYQPSEGTITFDGTPLIVVQERKPARLGIVSALLWLFRPLALLWLFRPRALPKHKIARLGIGRTFQNLALFDTMTVRDNVMIGGHCRSRGGFFANAVRLPFVSREERVLSEDAMRLMSELNLTQVAHLPVSALNFATRKRVELARALAGKPKLLLLDEPAAGLNHDEVDQLRALIVSIRDRLGLTVLLVEHHMNLVMRVSDKVVALDFGRVIADGTPAEVQRNPEVIRAYLGGSA